MEPAVGRFFRVKYPDWDVNERYSFNWSIIKNKPNIIQCHDYNKIKDYVRKKHSSKKKS